MTRKITFPRVGIYTDIIKNTIEKLGVEVMLPPPITQKTIKLGVKHSSDFMCFPFKVTLGNLIEVLDMAKEQDVKLTNIGIGCQVIRKGNCRLQHYFEIQKKILTDLGYDVDMVMIEGSNIFRAMKHAAPKNNYLKIIKIFWQGFREMQRLEQKHFKFDWNDTKKVRIGIVGEWYTCLEESINYNMFNRLKKLDVNVHQSSCATITGFIKHKVLLDDLPRKYKKQGKKYYSGLLAAHAPYSLWNMFYYKDMGFDCVFHLMPLSCFIGDTTITTERYICRKIRDINLRDKVLTHKGRFKEVKNIFKRDYEGEIFEINCGGLSKFKVTPEHPILVLKRKIKNHKRIINSPKFIKCCEINKHDFIAIPKSKELNHIKFFKSDMVNPKAPKYADINKFYYNKGMLRLLGYYLAEGCITYDRHKKKNRKYLSGVRFTFNKKENNFIEDIIKILKDNYIECYCKVYLNNKRPNTADLSISNRSLAYLLEKLCGKYCDKKELYLDLMQLRPELQLEIVKGFFRGDGCLRDIYGETTYRAVTTSFKLANQLFWILIRNNIKSTISEQNIKDRKKSWMIKISNAEGIIRMKDNIINVTKRINNVRFLETNEYFLIPIKKITKRRFKGEVYNLEVEDDNSYVANNLAVHNCMPESTVEMLMDLKSKELDLPVYHFPIDEEVFQTGTDMRIKSIVRILERSKNEIQHRV